MLRHRNIVVTGGAGFIGTNLCRDLLDTGCTNLYCIDNFYTGCRDNIKQFQGDPRFHLYEWDVRSEFPFQWEDISEIYHLACPASPVFYQKDPIYTMDTCYLGTKNVLEWAKKYPGVKVLFTSTSEVYGDPDCKEQPESYHGNVNTWGPRSCYDEGKRVAESLCLSYRDNFDLDIRVVRLFNTYGPYMRLDDGRVITNFIQSVLTGNPLIIHGQGTQTRSFQYISDLLRAFRAVMSQSKGILEWPINIGNPGTEHTILDVANLVLEMTSGKSEIKFTPAWQDDPKLRRPVIKMATSLLGWKPEIDLPEGLKNTIEYFFSENNKKKLD